MDGVLAALDQPEHLLRARVGSMRGGSLLRPQVLSSLSQSAEIASQPLSSTRVQPWLSEALDELGECAEEAREEGYLEPTQKALATAEAILKRIARLRSGLPEPSVYPSSDHEIVLFFCKGDAKAAVSLSVMRMVVARASRT